MQLYPVSSTNLVGVGYNAASMTLRIQFHSGLYDYYDVPQAVFEGLMDASSKGSYHAKYIKDRYRYRRIG